MHGNQRRIVDVAQRLSHSKVKNQIYLKRYFEIHAAKLRKGGEAFISEVNATKRILHVREVM